MEFDDIPNDVLTVSSIGPKITLTSTPWRHWLFIIFPTIKQSCLLADSLL